MGDKASVLIYPRGFMAVSDPSMTTIGLNQLVRASGHAVVKTPEQVNGARTVHDLWSEYLNSRINGDNWEFRKQVVAAASRMFGNFHTWLALQAEFNDYLYDLNFKFLLDTWKFITTGQRDMSPMTWAELLSEYPDRQAGVSSADRRRSLDMLEKVKDPDHVIGMWCSHDNGFGDMLCTLNVLFGVAREPLAKQRKP